MRIRAGSSIQREHRNDIRSIKFGTDNLRPLVDNPRNQEDRVQDAHRGLPARVASGLPRRRRRGSSNSLSNRSSKDDGPSSSESFEDDANQSSGFREDGSGGLSVTKETSTQDMTSDMSGGMVEGSYPGVEAMDWQPATERPPISRRNSGDVLPPKASTANDCTQNTTIDSHRAEIFQMNTAERTKKKRETASRKESPK
ncbi:uncharacterized protein RSE6_09235 [Rhynchosporium secalis]|uniref:Uncharacterized protein n=1 Tax=Rhynchosporium secalis TaxID=38038 RepID=A0A1E1MHG9_RHYSE|nr:uncharacterized protein RSE6_09235 [Rhynchosporium secalis]